MRTLCLFASAFLGWSLGANDAANVFGTAVASQMVRWRTSAWLLALFVLIGALVAGSEGLDTYRHLSSQNLNSALVICLAAATAVTGMTMAGIPISTSQAVVGAIIGAGLARGQSDFAGLGKIVACWVGTPLGAALVAAAAYPLLARVIRAWNPHFLLYDQLMRVLLVLVGVYGAFALGANNVANVTGVFHAAGAFGRTGLARHLALVLGGASIALGALTYSRAVMMTVGKRIIRLDAFSAFIVVLSEAITVHIYAVIGVPVSTSQAVVGAVLGIGLLKGMRTVDRGVISGILIGWALTPVLGGAIAFGLMMLGS